MKQLKKFAKVTYKNPATNRDYMWDSYFSNRNGSTFFDYQMVFDEKNSQDFIRSFITYVFKYRYCREFNSLYIFLYCLRRGYEFSSMSSMTYFDINIKGLKIEDSVLLIYFDNHSIHKCELKKLST